MHFHKLLDHLLLMTSYLVTIVTAIMKLVSKCLLGINEQLLKTSGADALSSKKNLRNVRGLKL